MTPADIAALRGLCEAAPEEIVLVTLGMYSDVEVPNHDSRAFYEAARSALPALLDECESQRSRADRLHALLVRAIDCLDDDSAARHFWADYFRKEWCL